MGVFNCRNILYHNKAMCDLTMISIMCYNARIGVRMDKKAYLAIASSVCRSTQVGICLHKKRIQPIDLIARRNAQMGIKMKLGLFVILLTGLLLTGCAQNTMEDMDNSLSVQSENEGAVAIAGNEVESAAGAEEAKGEESTEASENAETQEAYILTFEAVTMDGEAVTSECFEESKLTMLNVWATYCNPCLREMPDLGELAATYDTVDFQLFGIVSDVVEEDEEGMEYAKELITQTGAEYSHMPLNQSLYSNLVGGVDSVPTTFFVNQEGEVLGYVLGAQSKETWEEIINNLLAEME